MIPRYKLYHSIDELQNKQVHAVITSPPYFKLRKYGDSPAEIGRENSVDEYLDSLLYVFNSINLHPDGSLCVNIGDKRLSALMAIPEHFVLKMIQSGWKLIDKIVWAKVYDDDDGTTEGGCMADPAKGRFNGNGYEPIYRFVKSSCKTSWSDMESTNIPRQGMDDIRSFPSTLMNCETSIVGRRIHNVWRCPMGQTQKKHYAVYPPVLCERLIASLCPMRVCHECGHLERRIVEPTEYDEKRSGQRVFGKYNGDAEKSGRQDTGSSYTARYPKTVGWTTCECTAWKPGLVLDPFAGSGTTGEVAIKLGRDFIGVDLYDEYHDIMTERLDETIGFLKVNNLDPWELRQ